MPEYECVLQPCGVTPPSKACRHVQKHTHKQASKHTGPLTHKHRQTITHTGTHTHKQVHTHTRTQARTSTHTLSHRHTHTHTQASKYAQGPGRQAHAPLGPSRQKSVPSLMENQLSLMAQNSAVRSQLHASQHEQHLRLRPQQPQLPEKRFFRPNTSTALRTSTSPASSPAMPEAGRRRNGGIGRREGMGGGRGSVCFAAVAASSPGWQGKQIHKIQTWQGKQIHKIQTWFPACSYQLSAFCRDT